MEGYVLYGGVTVRVKGESKWTTIAMQIYYASSE